MKNYFQVSLDVEGRPCLVVGGGAEAEEKTGRLLDAGARVTVVTPVATPQLVAWAREGDVVLWRRRFAPGDLEGVHLAVNTVKSDPALSEDLYRRCEAGRILLSAYDQPEAPNFVMVALVRSGRLRVALATGASSPAWPARCGPSWSGSSTPSSPASPSTWRRCAGAWRRSSQGAPAQCQAAGPGARAAGAGAGGVPAQLPRLARGRRGRTAPYGPAAAGDGRPPTGSRSGGPGAASSARTAAASRSTWASNRWASSTGPAPASPPAWRPPSRG